MLIEYSVGNPGRKSFDESKAISKFEDSILKNDSVELALQKAIEQAIEDFGDMPQDLKNKIEEIKKEINQYDLFSREKKLRDIALEEEKLLLKNIPKIKEKKAQKSAKELEDIFNPSEEQQTQDSSQENHSLPQKSKYPTAEEENTRMMRSLISTPSLGQFIDSLEKYQPKIKNEDEPKKREEIPDYKKTGLNSKEMQEAAKQLDKFLKFQASFPSDSEISERQKRIQATPKKLTKSLEHLKDYKFLSSTAKKIWDRLKIFKKDKKYDDALRMNEENEYEEEKQSQQSNPLGLSGFHKKHYEDMLKKYAEEERKKNLKMPNNAQRQEMIEQLTTLANVGNNKKIGESHQKSLEKILSPEEQAELKEWQKSLGEDNSKEQVKEKVSQLLQNNHMIKITEGKYTITPNALRQIARKCLKEIFSDLEKGMIGRHETDKTSYNGLELKDSTKQYEFGDALNLDLTETLRNAIRKSAKLPINLDYEDFVIKETGHVTNSATVIAIDVSGSMNGLPLLAARKVTLALECLIEERFKGDYLGVIAFSEKARLIPSYSIAKMGNESSGATNFQEALLMSEKILAGKRALNKQIIIVSDMEPTTYNQDPPKVFLERLEEEIKKQQSIPRPKITALEEDKPLDDLTRKMLQELFGQTFGSLNAYSNPSVSAALYEASRLSKQKIKVNFYMMGSHPRLEDIIPVYSRFTTGKIFMPKRDDLGKTLMYDFLKGSAKSIS